MSENTALKPAEVKSLPLHRVQNVKHLLMNDAAREQLGMVAARHMSPERMMRVVANAIRTTPKLQQADPISFLGALMQCAALGLEPNTILGHAYLIPFDNKRKIKLPSGAWEERKVTEVQLVVGYKGLIDLARRSGHITSIHAGIHYSDDDLWDYEEGTAAILRHRPGPQSGKKMHAYAIAHFREGGHAYVVLPWSHVMRIRDNSQGYKTAIKYGKTDTPWIAHEDPMAKKTAIRALAKYLPLSVEFSDAMSLDGQRADYRAFAMDPSSGMALPMDEEDAGQTIDGEAEEQEAEPAKEEAKTEHKATPKAADKPKADPKPTERKAEKYAEADPKKEEAKPEPDAATTAKEEPARDQGDMFAGAAPQEEESAPTQEAEEVDFTENGLFRQFMADLDDLKTFNEVADLWGTDFSGLKETKPELYAFIVAEASKREAELAA